MHIHILDAKFNELPDIVSHGSTEEEAVEIFVILLNAFLLQGKERRFTNYDEKNNLLYTTYVIGILTFEGLREYMHDVYGVTVVMLEEE